MIGRHGCCKLVRVKNVFNHLGLIEVFLVLRDLDLLFEVCLLAKPFGLTHGNIF